MTTTQMKVIFRKRRDNESLYSKFIRLWTGGPYSHCELLFSDGEAFSSSEADGGTRFKKIDIAAKEWDALHLPINDADEARIRKFCENEMGCKYDWRGISFSFLPIPIGWQNETKWFCSEICTAGIQLAGFLSGFTPASISPNKLYKELEKELRAFKTKEK